MRQQFSNLSVRTLLTGVGAVTIVCLIGLGVAAMSALPALGAAIAAVFTILSVLLNGFFIWWIVQRIVGPLDQVLSRGRQLIQGDLTDSVTVKAAGEVGALHKMLDDIKDMLFNIVRDVRSGAISVDTTALTVNRDNQALSGRNESQAASIEETAASLEELSATVAHNAESAAQASDLVDATFAMATEGSAVVREVAATMDDIKDSSRQIVDIISVIDSIAFQTNILALNAAVEAAHAGEQGRGFAVVAAEVRHLAQRSAQEAKGIKMLVTASAEKVESGSKLVAQADQSMHKIVTSIKNAAVHMKEIATANQEQSAGIQQVNTAVVQLEALTHENNVLATDALAASAQLTINAQSLSEAVSAFSLGSGEGTAEEAVELVKQAVKIAEASGLQALIDEVNKLNKGKLVRKDLYIGIYGFDGNIRAHGANRHFIGVNTAGTKDRNGKPFIADMIALGQKVGSGWVHYLFAHPLTQTVKPKASYLERFDDAVICCGCYVDK